jgi:hypothetical protein
MAPEAIEAGDPREHSTGTAEHIVRRVPYHLFHAGRLAAQAEGLPSPEVMEAVADLDQRVRQMYEDDPTMLEAINHAIRILRPEEQPKA